jgi:hypothetical protein
LITDFQYSVDSMMMVLLRRMLGDAGMASLAHSTTRSLKCANPPSTGWRAKPSLSLRGLPVDEVKTSWRRNHR